MDRQREEMMIARSGLQVGDALLLFVEEQALPGTGIEPAAFWTGAARIIAEFAPENASLLAERDRLQAELDERYAAHAGRRVDPAEYQPLLR